MAGYFVIATIVVMSLIGYAIDAWLELRRLRKWAKWAHPELQRLKGR